MVHGGELAARHFSTVSKRGQFRSPLTSVLVDGYAYTHAKKGPPPCAVVATTRNVVTAWLLEEVVCQTLHPGSCEVPTVRER
jgi:hypothetical protein